MKTYITLNGNDLVTNGFQSFGGTDEDILSMCCPDYSGSFATFAESLRELNQDDSVPFLVIPNELDFKLPDTNYPELKDPGVDAKTSIRAINRAQICRWMWSDEDAFKDLKPVLLYGLNTLKEVRFISGLPGDKFQWLQADIEIGKEDNPYPFLFSLYSAADDVVAMHRLMADEEFNLCPTS